MGTLVGRQREIDAVNDSLTALMDGSGGTLFFAGEPGIGKSTLARFLSDEARKQSLPVYWGFCWESGGAPAYWPWTQLMRLLVSDTDIPEELVRNMGQLFPESVRTGDDQELQPDQARFLLLESVRSLLSHISQEQPLVLVLDDLHSADADSLFLLQYLAKHVSTMPVLLVGTYRELEARQSDATESLWRADRDALTLRLERFDQKAVDEYLAGTRNVSDETARSLLDTTGGNPLFLTELVGLLDRQENDRLPETIQQVIGQQISLLPEQAANLLGQASIFGREFDTPVLAILRNQDEAETEKQIEPAVTAGMISAVRPGHYRFSHVLHRDVLYNSLGTTTRQELHVRCAEYTRSLIDAGARDRWSSYAIHLQASGPDYRTEAVAAWEQAAYRAHERLAFDDAARSLQNALTVFADGPKFDPVRRVELQLHCAAALALAGRAEECQVYCSEAFATARTLQDATMMSEAALTHGNVIVVGKVDKSQIGMLRECVTALPAEDAAMRSRVQARLAAAMQPAIDPAEPMAMAREAIALARSTDDEGTLFAVLRSAISALMDFASARERMPLNREFEALAAKRRNVAGQFRSKLRLMFDAIELGDRQMLDDTIDTAEDIANRIDLPHYQWRVASARAMQYMMDGQFALATEQIDKAQQLAMRVGDLEAMITLPIQRFSILCNWDSDQVTPLLEIEAQLQEAYASGLAASEFFVRPLMTAFSASPTQAQVAQVLDQAAVIERTFSGGDRFSISMIGELAVNSGRTDLAQRAYNALGRYATECATLGLMGGSWFGPVGYSLGIIALGLEQYDEAQSHLETALRIAGEMRSQPMVARAHLKLAEVADKRGDAAGAKLHRRKGAHIFEALSLREVAQVPADDTAPSTTTGACDSGFSLHLDGDIRVVTYGVTSASLKDTKGLQILARLIATPDKDVHVLDLLGLPQGGDTGDAGPQLDAKARDEYRRRVTELQEEHEEATSLGDSGRADALQEELDFITRELSRAYGLGGRERRSSNSAERARVNVRRRLKDAIDRIGQQLPEAGRYLDNTIKTGSYCRYSPM